MSLSTQDYQIPNWSGPPSHPFLLQVIKDGSQIQQILLRDKHLFLIGKQSDVCDIVLDNPTISRKHAILQFSQSDDNAYLFDLNSTQGTFVNKRKLPGRVYHKLQLYDTIQFGASTRTYVIRCPQLEKEEVEEEPEDNQFQSMLKKQHQSSLNKEQMKEKYLDMLQNDPYYRSSQLVGRSFQGSSNQQEGINWGIHDQHEVYAYRDENDYPLEADLLRRLPGIDNGMLTKIAEYEQKLQKYQESEGQLRELANRQQRQFGLEEKARQKKQNLERRTVEMYEQMEKVENYIKLHLFGESTNKAKNEQRQKQTDTFQNDQFFDRTLDKKQKIDLEQLQKQQQGSTTEDYWRIKKRLQELLVRRKQLNKQLVDSATRTYNEKEHQDEYENFMNSMEDKLKKQNFQKLTESIKLNDKEIEIYREKLQRIRPQENSTIDYTEAFQSTEKVEIPQKTNKIMQQLKELEKKIQQIDEEDPEIFKYYEKQVKLQKKLKNTSVIAEQKKPDEVEETIKDPGPHKKANISRNAPRKLEEQSFVDITKHF